MDFAFTHATILAFDDAFSVHEDCDLVVSGGRIAALGPGAARGRPGRSTRAAS
jgi:cytosine/adenosine deaminase-related metal-dependent hydrolase